ncbi:MAG: zinc ABC transporter substrate-binding protein [Rhodovulum sp.]|nr:zinc ABC transporter substrate-binding protein [Rhodovulum sp.]
METSVIRRSILAAAALLVFAGPVLAQEPASATTAPAEPLRVVASFSILGDLVKQVGGPRVAVELLVGADADMHAFQPSPADSRKLAGARLVVINGLGFEGWAERMIKASGYAGPVVVVTRGLKPLARAGGGGDHGHGHDHGGDDPHAWQSVANAKLYVANIRDALAAADPSGEAAYRAAAETYLQRLDQLDRDIVAAFAGIPKERRRVITAHQAFRYFGAAYGITVRGAKGIGDEAEPTARDIAELIRQIKKERIRAVFVESTANRRLIERIAKDTDARVGGVLYADALSGPAGPAPGYVEMMRHNTEAIAAALRDTAN